MKKWLLSAAMLAAGGVATAQVPVQKPGYVIIRIKLSDSGGGETNTGGSGYAPPGGSGYGPPGGGDQRGGTQQGQGSGYGGRGGPPGGGDQRGGTQQGQGSGYGRGGPPSSGPGSSGPGSGPGPAGPGGPPAPPGPGGGFGGAGLGSPDGGEGEGGFGGSSAGVTAVSNERSVAVMVPYSKLGMQLLYKGKQPNQDRNPSLPAVHTTFGTTYLYQDGTNVQIKFEELSSVEHLLKLEHKRWNMQADRKPDALLRYIEQALRGELTSLAYDYADQLVTITADKKDLPPNVDAFLKVYADLKKKLGEALVSDPAVQSWKARFGGGATAFEDSPHYSIIHFGDQNLSTESLNRKALLLEKNFKSFYLWNAVKGGKLPPLPDKKLIVVVAKKGADMPDLRTRLDGLPIISDSFYSQQHNVVVLSPERGDELGRSFMETARSKYTRDGFDRNELLRGNNPQLKDTLKPPDVAMASTYALVDKVLEEEAEVAAISREGTRQLFAVTGLLPKHVLLPFWVESGMSSLLQHPKAGGVVELTGNKPGIALGWYTGHGAPNYQLLREFQTFYPLKNEGKEYKPEDVLRNTLTDSYFAAARTMTDLDAPVGLKPVAPAGGGRGGFLPGGLLPGSGQPGGSAPGGSTPAPPPPPGRGGSGDAQQPGGPPPPPPPPAGGGAAGGGGRGLGAPGGFGGGFGGFGGGIVDPNASRPVLSRERLEVKAAASAWGLAYYLTQTQRANLQSFYAELGRLPRDLRLDKDLVMKMFCQSFALWDDSKDELNEAAFASFAKEWMKYVRDQQPTWREVTLAQLAGNNNNRPGGNSPPGVPGGLGGPGAPGGLGGPGGPPGER